MSTKTVEKKDSYYRDVLRKFTAHKLAMIGVAVILLEVILVIVLPMIMKLDPYTSDILAFSAKPGAGHILGTDDTGRDVFARLVYGGRISLLVGLLSAIISLCIGVPLGLIAGYYKGIWETIVMRTADIFMSFPSMILILVLVNVLFLILGMLIGMDGYPGHRYSGLDRFRKTDLWQCAVGQRKGVCGICKGSRNQRYPAAHQICDPERICSDPDQLYIPYSAGDHSGVCTELFRYGCSATGSILGKYPVRGTVYHRTFLKTVAVGTAGNPAGTHCIRY